MTPWVLAMGAAWAVYRLIVRRPWPRRTPGTRPPSTTRANPLEQRRTRRQPPRRSRRQPPRRSRRQESGAADLVWCCDLLAVATSAGCTLGQAIAAVGAGGHGPVAQALVAVDQDVARGAVLVDAVERLVERVGPQVQSLVSTLVVASGAGTPVAPALQRLADAERRRRRRLVEARIRRLPVLLLFPLVAFILPAFVLMTLVPVALAAARSGVSGVAAGSPFEPMSDFPSRAVLSAGSLSGARP